MVNKEFSIVLLIGLILLFVYLFLLGKYGDKTLIGLIFVSGVITFLLYASDDVQRFAAKGFGTEVSIEKLQTVRNEVFASAQQVQTLAESTAVTVSTILSNFDYFAPKEGVESRPWTEDSEARRKGIEIHNNLKELLKSSDPKIANQALLPLERAIVKGIGMSLRGPIFYAVYEVKTGHKAGVGPYPDIATQNQIHAVSDQAMQLALDSRIGDASNELETFLKSQHIWTPEIQKAIQTFEDERRLLH